MGNYGADIIVNEIQAWELAGLYHFIPNATLKFDQWTLDSANRVSSFHDGTKLHQAHIKFNPKELPLQGVDE